MALLISCWFIIESIIIPYGFRKWFYLSFYIHPIFLFICQIFLWFKMLQRWLIIVSLPIRVTCFLVSSIFRFLRGFVVFLFSFTRVNNAEVVEEVNQFELQQTTNEIQTVHSYNCPSRAAILYELNISEFQASSSDDSSNKGDEVLDVDNAMEEHDLHSSEDIISTEYFSSNRSSNSSHEDLDMMGYASSVCSSNSPIEDADMSVYLPSVCSNSSPAMERAISDDEQEEELDSFYNKYTERMRWFDVLNYDRTCGINAILNKQYLGTPSSIQSIETVDFSIPYISWSKMARKRLLRSLESDFEMVYVAQSCLSWEALYHQYQKVEALIACSNTQNGVFYNNVAGKFQKFQVLLERFMEDERCYQTKRYWNYVQRRLSLKSLLQVPEISGYMEEEKDEQMKGESMRATEVLKAVEKSIEVFWLFVNTDKKRPWWKIRSSLWTHAPVEDPRDLELLADLSKTLQKKELWLKDIQRKKRCWLKRVKDPCGETQKKENLITMIDMKLVSRVLKMSMISTSQLKWCQEKLNNMEFKEGKFMRANTGPLFPSS